MVETVEPVKVHPTSMSYINEVFEAYQHLWIGIWLHKYTITTTDVTAHFWSIEWNPRWCQCANHATMPWLRLYYLSSSSHIHEIYARCLSTLNSCGWAYGCTLTPLPPETFLLIWESGLYVKQNTTDYIWTRRYGASLGGQNTLKFDILRVFMMSWALSKDIIDLAFPKWETSM